jgi:hypothetical protein
MARCPAAIASCSCDHAIIPAPRGPTAHAVTRAGDADAGAAGAVSDGGTSRNPLTPAIIQRIVRQNYVGFRKCYEGGQIRDPFLQGRVAVRFVIDCDGKVVSTHVQETSLTDPATINCVLRIYNKMSFPELEGGVVRVVYPIMFSPAHSDSGAGVDAG